MTRAAIIGTGFYVPPRVVTNDELAGYMDTSDEWIQERSGIRERHWVEPGTTSSSMACAAARMAIEAARIDKDEIDMVLFATLNPDYCFPGGGVQVEDELELNQCAGMDIRNQCTGFVYGLATADAFIRAGTLRTVLICGSEIHSTGLDVSTRGRDLAVLFGDGAGAAIVQATDEDRGVICSSMHCQGRYAKELWAEVPSATIMGRWTDEQLANGRQYPEMNGRAVFKHATRRFCEAINEVLKKGNVAAEDVTLVIPHQANQRITDMVTHRMKMAPERVYSNIARYGNTTAASIPIALAEAVREDKIQRGELLVTVAFGSGFTWGANLVRW